MTAAERLALVETARDNAITAMAAATGTAIMVKNVFDPDGGQITFQSRKELLAYIADLKTLSDDLADEVAAEGLGLTEMNAITIVRRPR